MMKIIGATTKYIGHEIPGGHGETMQILQIYHHSMLPETDMDSHENHAFNDDELAHIGGVTKHDRVETYIIKADGTRSSMSFDPRAIDLEIFAHLA